MSASRPRARPYGFSFALVLFDGRTSLPYLRVLKRGYRHCFALVQTGEGWLLFNPLSNATELVTLPKLRPDQLMAFFRADGLEVVPVQRLAPAPKPHPFMPYSCVEAVKRVLGIRERRVMTPWQLRKRLGKPG